MREEVLTQVRERSVVGDHLFYLLVLLLPGAHSISEEVAGFSPLWFPQVKFFVSLSSYDYLCACYSLR